jgi:hypothetical protein
MAAAKIRAAAKKALVAMGVSRSGVSAMIATPTQA